MSSYPRREEDGVPAPTPWRAVLLNVVCFLALCVLAFHRNEPSLFAGLDGSYMRVLVKEQWVWKGLELGFTNNFLQSLGNVWFPMNALIIPGYLVSGAMHGGTIDPLVSYTIFALELFVTTLILARFAGLNWTIALFSAWLLPLIAHPFVRFGGVYPILALIPHLGTGIAVTIAIAILCIEIGKHKCSTTLWQTGGLLALWLYTAVSQPTIIVLMVPLLAIFFLFALVHANTLAEVKIKLACTAGVVLALALTGTISYVYGLLKFTPTYFFPGDFFNDRMELRFVSILFKGRRGISLFVLGCLGALLLSIHGGDRAKVLARATLVCAAGVFGIGVIATRFDFSRGPSAVYFESFLWPFFAVFTVAFLHSLWIRLQSISAGLRRRESTALPHQTTQRNRLWLVPIIAWLVVTIAQARMRDSKPFPPFPPPKSSIVEILEREIGLAPGEAFRGRVATLTGRKLQRSVNWLDLHLLDHRITQRIGNDHRMVGLWYYDIPTLMEYSSLITPAFHLFTKVFFSVPGDSQVRSVMTLRRPEPRLLEAIGVRFVITDEQMDSGTLRTTIPLSELGELYLYELSSPNVGQYSPQKVVESHTAGSMLAVLAREEFHPAKELVTDFPLPKDLVAASSAHLSVERGRLRISALSEGRSALLLPLEFSRCLSLVSNAPQGVAPQLFRANLLQAAVLFHGELDGSIRYTTGPLENSMCRLMDADDLKRLLGPESSSFP